MDIKRKKITNEEIFSAEMNRAADIRRVCDEQNPLFAELGYELDLLFGQKEHEAENSFSVFTEEQKPYEFGYLSRALVTVKRLKTDEEKAEVILSYGYKGLFLYDTYNKIFNQTSFFYNFK